MKEWQHTWTTTKSLRTELPEQSRSRHPTDKQWLIGAVKLAGTWLCRFQNKFRTYTFICQSHSHGV